ncbi:hypothetical protein ABK040_008234 [Willaertia magna]
MNLNERNIKNLRKEIIIGDKLIDSNNVLHFPYISSTCNTSNFLVNNVHKQYDDIVIEQCELSTNSYKILSNSSSLLLANNKELTELFIECLDSSELKMIEVFSLMYQSLNIKSIEIVEYSFFLINQLDKDQTIKILTFLKTWITQYYLKFSKFEILGNFIKVISVLRNKLENIKDKSPRVIEILDILNSRNDSLLFSSQVIRMEKHLLQRMSNNNSTITSLLDINIKECCKHLTYLFGKYFLMLEPQEFLNANWTKPKRKHLSPNIINNINQFNHYSLFFASLIVNEINLEKRKVLLEYLIKLGMECIKIGNLFGVYVIGSALRNPSVFRLKNTFSLVSEKRRLEYEKIQSVMSTDSNSANYNKLLKDIIEKTKEDESVICIPNLGKHLNELTLIEEGVKDVKYKMELFYGIINSKIIQIQQFLIKRLQHSVTLNFQILQFLLETNGKCKNNDVLIELSKKIETTTLVSSPQQRPSLAQLRYAKTVSNLLK